ncbi:MAG TPA: hypothetical protein VKB65_06410 [Myxococcota bacterium]|nr:hypothetical protein [Myxococcota bacterium]
MRSPRTPCANPTKARPDDDCRCRCGSLVARIVADGVEIKCRRCKRDLLVPWSAREGWARPVEREEPAAAASGGTA